MRTGGGDTAVVCLLLDCCNTGTPFVLSGLETVFVGCVTCCFVAWPPLLARGCLGLVMVSCAFDTYRSGLLTFFAPCLLVVLHEAVGQAAVRGGRRRRAGPVGVGVSNGAITMRLDAGCCSMPIWRSLKPDIPNTILRAPVFRGRSGKSLRWG